MQGVDMVTPVGYTSEAMQTLFERKALWDAKAKSFAHKPQRSGYIAQFLNLLDIDSSESVFDIGCGPGTVAVPLAKRGCTVYAADFSTSMLDELHAAAREQGVAATAFAGLVDAEAAGDTRFVARSVGGTGIVADHSAICSVDGSPTLSASMSADCSGNRFAGLSGESSVGHITTFVRAWEDDWSDIPCADVALSSRSLITGDVAGALYKLETRARKRVYVTVPAGETPWTDARISEALGRRWSATEASAEFDRVIKTVRDLGRVPQTSFIRYLSRPHASSREDMIEKVRPFVEPLTAQEGAALVSFIDEHMLQAESGGVELDYQKEICWGCVSWSVK